MPSEIRRLLFSNDEVLQALMDINTRSGNKYFPEGQIGELEITEDPTPVVKTVIEVTHNRSEEATIATATLGAALIGFCMRQSIPLPARANKSLKVVKGRLAMDIKIG